MPSQDINYDLINLILNADLNQLSQLLVLRLVGEVHKHSDRINALESRDKEILQRLDRLESEIPYLRHLVCRNEELQNLVDFHYPPD